MHRPTDPLLLVLDLGEGLPDFDARYHDFRVDCDDPNRIWCTMRVQGTHTGVLSFGGIKAEPKSPPTFVQSPPEAVSLSEAKPDSLLADETLTSSSGDGSAHAVKQMKKRKRTLRAS